MFTGIIRYTGKVTQVKQEGKGRRLEIEAPSAILSQLEPGITSVALNGSCHTVETCTSTSFTVFSSFETVSRTTIGQLSRGQELNLELPLTPTTLLDGHLVQGHVDGMGQLVSVTQKGEAYLYRFSVPAELQGYLVEKDSIAIDGISLTLYNISGQTFEVALIPQTAARTSLGKKKSGDSVNLEVNIFAKYTRQFTSGGGKSSKLQDWIDMQG